MDHSRLLYFASADGGIDHKLEKGKDFEISLVYNVLFGDSPLTITDVFFFNCNPLLEHIEAERPGHIPFFLAALKRGLIIPAYRDPDIETFRQGLERIGEQRIRGTEGKKFDLTEIAKSLDRFRPSDMRPAVWRPNLGLRFEERMDRVLVRPGDDIRDDEVRQMWQSTENWRIEGLAGAKRLTLEQGGTGLRRAEIWNAVGHYLGLLDRDKAYSKPVDFIQNVTFEMGKSEGEAAAFFTDVVNFCYQQNQADGIQCYPGQTGLEDISAEPNVPRALSKAGLAVITGISPDDHWEQPDRIFEHMVRVPKVKSILNAKSTEIIAIREGNEGQSYRSHRTAWIDDPSDENADRLRQALDKYATGIRRAAKGAQENTMFKVIANVTRLGLGAAVGTSIGKMAPLIEGHPGYILVGALAGAGAAASAIIKDAQIPSMVKYPVQIPHFSAEYNLGSTSEIS